MSRGWRHSKARAFFFSFSDYWISFFHVVNTQGGVEDKMIKQERILDRGSLKFFLLWEWMGAARGAAPPHLPSDGTVIRWMVIG